MKLVFNWAPDAMFILLELKWVYAKNSCFRAHSFFFFNNLKWINWLLYNSFFFITQLVLKINVFCDIIGKWSFYTPTFKRIYDIMTNPHWYGNKIKCLSHLDEVTITNDFKKKNITSKSFIWIEYALHNVTYTHDKCGTCSSRNQPWT